MTIKKFSISNFRSLPQVEVSLFSGVTLIVGSNDVGKTSFLEALFLGTTEVQAQDLSRLLIGRGSRWWQSPTDSRTLPNLPPWAFLFPQADLSATVVLEYESVEGESHSVSYLSTTDLNDPRFHLTDTRTDSFFPQAGPGQILVALIECPRGGKHKHTRAINVFGQEGSFNRSSGASPHAVGVGKSALLSPRQPASDNLFVGFSEANKSGRLPLVVELLQGLNPDISGMELNATAPGEFSLDVISTNSSRLPLAVFGDGVLQMASIAFEIVNASHGLVLLDEIGSGVHFRALPRMWQLLHALARACGTQIVATTHSDDCVWAAASMLSEAADFGLIRFDRFDGQFVQTTLSSTELNEAVVRGQVEVR